MAVRDGGTAVHAALLADVGRWERSVRARRGVGLGGRRETCRDADGRGGTRASPGAKRGACGEARQRSIMTSRRLAPPRCACRVGPAVPSRYSSAMSTLSESAALERRARELDAADPLRAFRERFVADGDAGVVGLPRRQLARPPAARRARADGALRPRGVGRAPDPRLGRGLARVAGGDRRPPRPRRARRRARPGRRRGLDERDALQARARRGRRPARTAARSSSTRTTSRPTATSSRASRPSAAWSCGSSRRRSTAARPPSRSPPPSAPRPRSSRSATSTTAPPHIADAAAITARRARGGRARALGPQPLRRGRSRSRSTTGAPTSPSAAPTSTSTAVPDRRRSATSAPRTRTRCASRSRAGSGGATRSRWAPATSPPTGCGASSAARRPSSRWCRSTCSLDVIEEAGMAAIRAKSVALGDYAIELADALLAPLGVTRRLAARRRAARRPRDAAPRRVPRRCSTACGATASSRTSASPTACASGLSPLTTTFAEVHRGFAALATRLTARTGKTGE